MAGNFFDASLLPDFARKFEVQLAYAGFQNAQLSTLRNMPLQSLAASYRTVGASGIPVLLIWGRADRVIPFETSEQVKAAMPQTQLLAVERAAHTPNYERPEVVNPAIVRFLASFAAPARDAPPRTRSLPRLRTQSRRFTGRVIASAMLRDLSRGRACAIPCDGRCAAWRRTSRRADPGPRTCPCGASRSRSDGTQTTAVPEQEPPRPSSALKSTW